ncbi:vasa RNA helicase [Anopheles sinensis]|uniref:Vasa RNA helicase n=1 Tax=Anopheles sinensis TaxID=74873 RepID=A0A084VX50_ANOSI|nr:vasa RNA helicase [Anopheles sinensis]
MKRFRPEVTGEKIKKRDCYEHEIDAFGFMRPWPIYDFEAFGLHDALLRNLRRLRYQPPTEILPQAVSAVLSGRDLLACSWFDSVMVAAFMVPIVQNILTQETLPDDQLLAIVFVPNRSLAEDVRRMAMEFVKDTPVTVSVLHGATVYTRITSLTRGMPTIAIVTPCSLTQFLRRRLVCLCKVLYVVMIHTDKPHRLAGRVAKILADKRTPPIRQKLVFLTHHVTERPLAAELMLNRPIYVSTCRCLGIQTGRGE